MITCVCKHPGKDHVGTLIRRCNVKDCNCGVFIAKDLTFNLDQKHELLTFDDFLKNQEPRTFSDEYGNLPDFFKWEIPKFHKGGAVERPPANPHSYFIPTMIDPTEIDRIVKKSKPFRPGIYYIKNQLKKLKERKKD